MNETNEMWREIKAEVQGKRNAREVVREGRLARAVAAGLLDAKPLGDYGWRLMANDKVVDYWPRTGTYRTPDGAAAGTGWVGALNVLGVTWPKKGLPR